MTVAGEDPLKAKVTLSPAPARDIGPYHVEMILEPRTLVAGRETQLAFRLEHDGQPVTDLSPYIGAMGHCVIVQLEPSERVQQLWGNIGHAGRS